MDSMDDLSFSTVTRITGVNEQVGLDVVSENQKGRAAVSSLEIAGDFITSRILVTSSATEIPATPNRRAILVQNLGEGVVYIAKTAIDASNGVAILPNASIMIKLAAVSIFIVSSSSSDVRILEVIE